VRKSWGIPPAASARGQSQTKNETLVKTALGMGARKGLSSYPDTSSCDT
jgi:hypothetical protein